MMWNMHSHFPNFSEKEECASATGIGPPPLPLKNLNPGPGSVILYSFLQQHMAIGDHSVIGAFMSPVLKNG